MVWGFVGYMLAAGRRPSEDAAEKIADMERLLVSCDADMARLHAEIAGLRGRLSEYDADAEVDRAG